MEWKPEYSVGVPSIDNQHKKLFALLKQLFEAMKQGKGSEKAPQILDELVAYTKVHFAQEEQYMLRIGYTDYARHKAEHDRLTQKVVEMIKSYQQKKLTMGLDLMSFLEQWLTSHILGCDQRYSSAFEAVGIR